MKKLVILLLLAMIATGQAQVIQLDEARVNSQGVKVKPLKGDLKFAVIENSSHQFQKDAIGFMKENFDIPSYIQQSGGGKHDVHTVEFRNKKGFLVAHFNGSGTLLSTSQRFKNIPVPLAVSRKIITDYKGWSMTKTLYLARGKGDVLDNELYKITMKNGKKTKRVKINQGRSLPGLVGNY